MQRFILSMVFIFVSSLIQAQSGAMVHEVEKGETLYAIAKKYHVTVEAIQAANKALGADFKLKIGQKLNIPSSSSRSTTAAAVKPAATAATPIAPKPEATAAREAQPAPAASVSGGVHIVAKGETGYAIAKANGLTWKQLRDANHLTDDMKLKLGQKLIIPSKNPEAMYKPAHQEPQPESKPLTKPAPAATTEQGKEYQNAEPAPIKTERSKAPETLPQVSAQEPRASTSPANTSKQTEPSQDENPFLPRPADASKPIAAEPHPSPAEPAKTPPASAINENVDPSAYSGVYGQYAESGRRKVVYRGIGTFIQSDNPGNQSLALYNYADMGSILKVTNLMSKETIYVKVIGKVPAADGQKDVILKISADAASRLKVSEDKFLVEVTGYNVE